MKVSVASAMTGVLLVAVVAWWLVQTVDVLAPPVAMVASGSSSAASTVPVIGAAPPQVALRGDASIELRIEPSHTVSVRVLDDEGAAVDGAEVVVDPGVAAYPSLYFGRDAKVVSDPILHWSRKRGVAAHAGRVVLPIDRGQPLALGARHRDHLSDFRVFAVGEVPAEIVFVLPRAGTVRGVVRGGSVGEYGRSVAIWRLADDAQMLVEHEPFDLDAWSPRRAAVDADGGFVGFGLEPGAWRAAVSRRGAATLGDAADQQVGAVPLIDEGCDLRAVVDFHVVAGSETKIELVDAPLGTLRGRVMLRGAPCADAQVVGVRPGWRSWMPDESEDTPPDWNSRLVRGSVAGQHTAADGSFVFLYRTAGPVELRLRHVRGAATSPPTTIVLPAPAIGMECTLELEAGSIAGSFATAQLPSELRRHAVAVLYPLHKAGGDPWYQTDCRTALSQYRAKVELGADGRFAFDYLPAGDWLLRVECGACVGGPLWQRIVTVQGELVELGELQSIAGVVTTVRWRWPAGDPMVRSVYGMWAYSPHGADARAIWVGTFPGGNGSTVLRVPPGRYTVEPFGREGDVPYVHFLGQWGMTGSRLAQPIAIEVHEDGRVTPAELALTPLPPR
jgi:hypothetical protein